MRNLLLIGLVGLIGQEAEATSGFSERCQEGLNRASRALWNGMDYRLAKLEAGEGVNFQTWGNEVTIWATVQRAALRERCDPGDEDLEPSDEYERAVLEIDSIRDSVLRFIDTESAKHVPYNE